MKRLGNLYEKITSLANLQEADRKAQLGKIHTYGVQLHNQNREGNLLVLQDMLLSKTYRTSQYDIFTIHEPKERLVYRLPYFPDRIAHHAVMNVLEPILVSTFTADTYSCIKRRGIHLLLRNLKNDLKDISGTKYCLKFDIKKFYPSIDHNMLKALLRRKFKDKELLWLLDEIIDSAPGLPIGNYLSQYLANFYLAYFDHWLKEEKRVKYYYRYADDIVILDSDKPRLHALLEDIRVYLDELKLEVKENYQVFPVAARGIDFVGYVFYHTHIRVRKQIKKNFARKLAKNPNDVSTASYMGWLRHADARHLTKKLLSKLKNFKDFNIKPNVTAFIGEKIPVKRILNTEIKVLDYRVGPSKQKDGTKLLTLQIERDNGEKRIVFTGSNVLIDQIERIAKENFPFMTTIRMDNEYLEFT